MLYNNLFDTIYEFIKKQNYDKSIDFEYWYYRYYSPS